MLALGARLIEERRGEARGGVDVAGSVLVTAAMMIAVYAIVTAAEHGWGSAHTLGFGGVAAVLLAAFIALEARIANPILPLRVLRMRTLIGASVVRGFLVTGMFGSWVLGSLYLEGALGYDPWRIGLAFLPTTLIVGLLSLGTTARVMARIGPERTVLAGLAIVVLSLLLLTGAGANASYFPDLFLAYGLMGLGIGTAMLPLLTIAMSGVPEADAGLASGIVNVSMQLAGALGIAVLGTLASDRTQSLAGAGATAAAALTGGYHLALDVAALSVAAGDRDRAGGAAASARAAVRSELAVEV